MLSFSGEPKGSGGQAQSMPSLQRAHQPSINVLPTSRSELSPWRTMHVDRRLGYACTVIHVAVGTSPPLPLIAGGRDPQPTVHELLGGGGQLGDCSGEVAQAAREVPRGPLFVRDVGPTMPGEPGAMLAVRDQHTVVLGGAKGGAGLGYPDMCGPAAGRTPSPIGPRSAG